MLQKTRTDSTLVCILEADANLPHLVEVMEVKEANSHVVPAHVVHAAVSLRISLEPTTTTEQDEQQRRQQRRKRRAENNGKQTFFKWELG